MGHLTDSLWSVSQKNDTQQFMNGSDEKIPTCGECIFENQSFKFWWRFALGSESKTPKFGSKSPKFTNFSGAHGARRNMTILSAL